MKQISIAILLCLCTLAGFAQGGQPLDLKDIVSGKFRAENIYGVIPIPGDGEHYSQMNAEGTQIIKYSFKTGKQVEVLFDAATARECPFKTFDSYSFSPDGSKLLLLQNRLRFIAALIQLYIIYIVMRFYLPSRDKIKKLFKNMEEIKRLISENKLEEAIRLLDAYLTEQPRSDEAWFLLGKAHYKLGNVRLALNSYLQAIEINPESPAQAAYDMAIKVLDFYNKDMYNH